MSRRWPDRLWIVRHGESAGNVARDAAYAAGAALIDIVERDVDVPLSPLGHEQATALGRWFADMPEECRPTAVLSSPYLRAQETTQRIVDAGGAVSDASLVVDERLREKEFGILDRLTRLGISERFPDQAEARSRLGKFYFRPPGGESWCDVILRLRGVLDTVSLHYSKPGARVLIVAHQVIVLCMRYLIEEMSEQQILSIDREGEVANCGVTEYALDTGHSHRTTVDYKMRLVAYNFVAPLEDAGTTVTAEPDAAGGVR